MLEKEMATHSSILAWKIPWTEKPGKLQSMRLQTRTWLSDFTFTFIKKFRGRLPWWSGGWVSLPVYGTWVWSLAWEDYSCGATKSSVPLLPRLACSRAHVMQLLSMFAAIIEAHAPRARPLQHEKPLQLNQEWPLLSETGERLCSSEDPVKPKIKCSCISLCWLQFPNDLFLHSFARYVSLIKCLLLVTEKAKICWNFSSVTLLDGINICAHSIIHLVLIINTVSITLCLDTY